MAALRSVSLTEQPSRKATEVGQPQSSVIQKADMRLVQSSHYCSHLVCVGWAWHAPAEGDSVGDFWSQG